MLERALGIDLKAGPWRRTGALRHEPLGPFGFEVDVTTPEIIGFLHDMDMKRRGANLGDKQLVFYMSPFIYRC